MPLNKLDSIIKNTEGRILYVSPADLDSTDSIANQGNSLARPFKTLQRALIESARFSYVKGNSNDETEKTTILLMPGEHVIDNRPGYSINSGGTIIPSGGATDNGVNLALDTNFDLTQQDNFLFRFNSVNGGVIVPRGTSVVGLDLRKTKLRPLYIPNPTDDSVENSAIFRITGACYFWQFSIFDGDELKTVYTQKNDFSQKSLPTFSHHKLTVFEYADGVNEVDGSGGLTDLQMYYAKLSKAYADGSSRPIDSDDVFPTNPLGFNPKRPEFEIVGAFAADPINIQSIQAGSGGVATRRVTVTTTAAHGLNVGTPIIIENTGNPDLNISTKVTDIDNDNDKIFFYSISKNPQLVSGATFSAGTVKIETDTVTGASPYIFNISMRSVWGMNGMHTDGSKATGFRSMVVAQFTGVSLQKDDRAFVKYNESNRAYENTFYSNGAQFDPDLSANSSSTGTVYHLDSDSVYRKGWEQTHIKLSNDAIVQVVSVFAIGYNKHFEAQSGGDASITNSNSNFGQLSLVSEGFRKEAFEKDDKAFITHIIPPRAIDSAEEEIDWLTLDNSKNGNNGRLYLFGFTDKDVKPPVLTQGYRVGAKVGDKLFLGANSTTIVMPNSNNKTSVKTISFGSGPTNNIFTTGTHQLETGEKVVITSDDGDLPENLKTNTVYYAIKIANNQLKLAASEAEALIGEAITVYGGTNLTILSRVSDKVAGDKGHPVQYDDSANQWYINVNGTGIKNALTGSAGATEPTTIKRIPDNRSLDEKIYKFRVVVPSQLSGAKTPESGFIIQESSSTGIRTDGDADAVGITTSDYDFNRNLRIIKTASETGNTVTAITELPHNLQVGDSVIVKNITDSTNTSGLIDKGYNGTFDVASINDEVTFTYGIGRTAGTFTNNVNNRTTDLPRFERNDCQSNLYIYRNEIISEYDSTNSNGVYHIYALNANNAIQNEFTNLKYSQNVTDLYPQLDRDNPNDNPDSSTTYALRSPLGEVQTNDLKKSITRESADSLLKTFGIGLKIIQVQGLNQSTPKVKFDRNHNFGRIVKGAMVANPTNSFTPGTYYNVKIYNNTGLTQWNGATAKVAVAPGGNISSVEIMNGGSGYSAGTYYLDTGVIGSGNNNEFAVTNNDIYSGVGHVIQFIGEGIDTYHRISEIVDRDEIRYTRASGDQMISTNEYAFVTAPSVSFTASGDTITATGHGLSIGNKFRSIDGSNNNVGDYIVESVSDVNTFTVTGGIGAVSGFILKHGLSSNGVSGDDGVSDKTDENLASRGVAIFDGEVLTINSDINNNVTQFAVTGAQGGIIERFPLGTYFQVDDEIMRIASNSLINTNEITVIRGALATRPDSHDANSVIKKIKVPAIEFHRPSIIRASGHTFEYLGYGPGNYSTALPQVQDRTLTEREEFLSQSQERSGGLVVYTGMNNKGDFFIGNQKKSSATGEETNFDIPVPTVTGEDPARLSAVFDEVTIKERLVVEGGSSNQVLSQFDGPVTFNEKLKAAGTVKISNVIDSTSTVSGALVVTGGVGIGKTLNVGGDLNVAGNTAMTGTLTVASAIVANGGISGSINGDTSGNVTGNVTGDILSPDGTIVLNNGTGNGTNSTFSGNAATASTASTAADLSFGSANQIVFKNSSNEGTTSSSLVFDGTNLTVDGDITAFASDDRLKTNKISIDNAGNKVKSLNGFTFNFNDIGASLGFDKEKTHAGVSAQEVQKVLPEAVTKRADGEYLTVKYEKLIPLLIEAIKELSDKVDELEQKLSDK